jgi:hypothetical protein
MYSKMCSITDVSDITPIIKDSSVDEVMPENPPNTPTATDVESTASTVIATPVEEVFTYVKNNVELANYAIDFLEDESCYYNIMQSYTTEKKVALFILVNGLVCAAGHYYRDGSVHEYLRNDTPHKVFPSISHWLNDYFDNTVSVTKILDSVHIGEDLVPIWMALIDAKEGDDMLRDESADSNKDIEYNNINPNTNTKDVLIAIAIGIIIASIFVPIVMAFI